MPSEIYGDMADNWELDPDIRDSVHLLTKQVPVDVTLTTAGTAQNLFIIDDTIRPTVNLITNPSFETGTPPTGMTASGSTLAQSNTVARTGTYSLRITPDNAAVGEGAYWTTESFGTIQDFPRYLVASIYLQDNADSGNGVKLIIADSSGITLATSATIVLSSSWQRATVVYPLVNPTAQTYRVYVKTATQFATVHYADNFQLEINREGQASSYCDGSLGLNYDWVGTAHASRSIRRRPLVQIRGYTLHTTRDIYIAYDQTASSTNGRYVRAGTDWWVDKMVIKNKLSFINVNVGEQPRVYGEIFGVHYGKLA